MSQVQTNQRETRFQDERNQEMQKVAVQIDDIHAIQTELNQLVHDQGQQVNDIEAHIDATEQVVAEGVEQLQAAGESAKTGRKWQIIGAILLLVLILVLLFSFWSKLFG